MHESLGYRCLKWRSFFGNWYTSASAIRHLSLLLSFIVLRLRYIITQQNNDQPQLSVMKESLHHIRSAIRRRLHVQQKDHDAEGAENITIASLSINNVTPPQSQDGKLIVTAVVPTVPTPLHVLCENCRKFERECRLLDYVGTKPLNTDPTKSIYELCSVVELLHNETTCHFCRLIAGSCESRAVQGSLENQFAAGDRVRLRLKLDVDNGYVSVQVQSQASGVTVAELCIYPIGMQRNDKPIRVESSMIP
jgi:hypothetical protein